MRILIVDDHATYRQSIRHILETLLGPETESIAEVANGESAVIKAGEMHPDLVIMDIRLPGINGLEAMRRIKAERVGVQVVIVTANGEPHYREKAFKLGAADFITKDKVIPDLLPLLRSCPATTLPTPHQTLQSKESSCVF